MTFTVLWKHSKSLGGEKMSEPITLKAMRVNRGLTIQQMADACKVHPDTIIQWEAGKRFPNVPKILALQECLHCRFDDIRWVV